MTEQPRGTELIVAGDFNVDLEKTDSRGRDKEIEAAVATEGLEDLAGHYLIQRREWCKDQRMWAVVRYGMEVRSRTDYTLGYDRQIFHNVDVQDPRHNSDHIMVLGCLHVASPRKLSLPRVQDAPPTTSARTSDKDAGRQDLC